MEFQKLLNRITEEENSALFFTPPYYDNAVSYLFTNPKKIISINGLDSLEKKLKKINTLVEEGYSAYSLINYEAGFLFEKSLNKYLTDTELIKFVFFEKNDVKKTDSDKLIFTENDSDKFKVKSLRLNQSKSEFAKNIKTIKKYISAGDTYQVNYTVKGKFIFSGDAGLFFQHLLFNQSARYSAFINNGEEYILSLSPELFFERDGNKITTRPMKGTARREANPQKDNLTKYELSNSPKNRAENVMIVDLLRNDLGRISKFGSVKANNLFNIEKYESLYQMVSTASSELRKNISLTEIIKNIFPCGSITGAPKIRTMEIIHELEKERRGIYTGSIGMIHKKKQIFNVAIRTLKISKKGGAGEIGLGSGIVWDSKADEEYKETLLKSQFIKQQQKSFYLFETMLLENNQVRFLDDHLSRLEHSSDYFLFKFNKEKILNRLEDEIESHQSPIKKKVRLKLNKWGQIDIDISSIQEQKEEVKVIVSKIRTSSENQFNYFKTSNRSLYDEEYNSFNKKGFYEVLFMNERSEIVEGSRTNIFIVKDDTMSTPSLNGGLLAGVYRKFMLNRNPGIKEKILHYEDLINADEILLTNAIRGELKVSKLFFDENEFREFYSFSIQECLTDF